MFHKSKYLLFFVLLMVVSTVVLSGAHTSFSFSANQGSITVNWDAWGDFDSVNVNATSDLSTVCFNPNGRTSKGRLKFRQDYSWVDVVPYAGQSNGTKQYQITIDTNEFMVTPDEAGCANRNGSVQVSGDFTFVLDFIGARGAVDSWTWSCAWSYDSASGNESLGACVERSRTNNGKK